MALAVVGGAFLSSALNVLFDRMASRPVVDFIRGKKNTTELLYKLKIKLLSVSKLLDDAEEKQIRDSRIKKWLDELKDVLYQADDLLDEINTQALRCKMEQEDSAGSSSCCNTYQVLKFYSSSVHKLGKSLEPRLVEILDRLEFIVGEKDVLDLKEGVKDRTQARQPTTSLVEESSVYGRDEEKEAIIKKLLADGITGNNTDVLPLVGMGGIGKTTLAQLVYNDDRVQKHFDHRSWFCVSEGFDVTKITQSIYQSVTSQVCDISDPDMLQVKLKTALTGKKFLFVFDDVWTVNNMEWELLSRPFVSGMNGSKIVVTTRIESVACGMGCLQVQHLMQLSEENCWSLFSKHAFKNVGANPDPSLEVIGRQIVQKCKGLPLAAKSLGGLLRYEPSLEKWEEILNSGIWEMEENDILPALWLSYYYLPPYLKRCFAYCSLFPQDYQFDKQKLVLLWMAEDLLPSKSKSRIEEVGDKYFDDLLSRSFFQPQPNRSSFIMHDLIHDLANFVSGDFCVRLEGNDSIPESFSKCRHFSWIIQSFDQWESLYKAKYLRTFLPTQHNSFQARPNLDFEVFPKLQYLRVLSWSFYSSSSKFTKLPKSISQLKHLRHFDLSWTEIKKLPDEICTLHNLQTLLLSNCMFLVELPTDLGRLVNLRHLDIMGTRIKKMPPRMGKMKDLQTLRGKFVLDKNTGGNIVEIKELEQLRGTLYISGLRNIVHVRDATEASMRNKKYLNELVLKWGGNSDDTEDTQKERDVLDNLQPHTNVKHLTIQSYGGTRFPGWLEDHCNLVRLKLVDCGNCLLLPSVEQLPSLQELEIERFNGEGAMVSKPFPNLRKLRLHSCPQVTGTFMLANFPKLEILSLREVNVEYLHSPSPLALVRLSILYCPNFVGFTGGRLDAPNLTSLGIKVCWKLRSLPQDMHKLLPSLNWLNLSDCPELESFPEGGLPSKLESLSIDRCKKLSGDRVQWGLPTLTALRFLTVNFEGCEQVVDSFPDEGLLPTTLSRLDICGISKLDGKGLRQLTSLWWLQIEKCPQLRCLPDEGLPTSLSSLVISGCPLLENRCQRDTGEDWPKIAHIKSLFINNQYI